MSDEGENIKMKPFRKLRQVVAAAAMHGYSSVLPREGEAPETIEARDVLQGTVIAGWLAAKFPDMGVAVAAQRLHALQDGMQAGEYGSDQEPGYRAADAVCDVLQYFVLTAPAATIEAAAARVTFWFDRQTQQDEPSARTARIVAERIKADFRALAADDADANDAHTIAGWRYRNPFHGGSK